MDDGLNAVAGATQTARASLPSQDLVLSNPPPNNQGRTLELKTLHRPSSSHRELGARRRGISRLLVPSVSRKAKNHVWAHLLQPLTKSMQRRHVDEKHRWQIDVRGSDCFRGHSANSACPFLMIFGANGTHGTQEERATYRSMTTTATGVAVAAYC